MTIDFTKEEAEKLHLMLGLITKFDNAGSLAQPDRLKLVGAKDVVFAAIVREADRSLSSEQPKIQPTKEEREVARKIVMDILEERKKLRDEFAKAALTGLLVSPNRLGGIPDADRMAEVSYELADAMLKVGETK